MDKIAEILTNYIMNDNKRTDLEREVIRYGIDALLSTILCLSCAILISSLLNGFIFGISFIITLTPIKMSFSGYHCRTMGQCICTYGFCVGIFTIIYQLITYQIPLIVYLLILMMILFLVKAEVNSKTALLLLIYSVCGVLLFKFMYDAYVILLLACLFEMLLLILHRTKSIKK